MREVMVPNIQERLSEIVSHPPTLEDGLAVYDLFTEIDQLRNEHLRQEIGLLEKVKKDALSHRELSTEYRYVKRWFRASYDRTFIRSDPESVEFFGKAVYRACKMLQIIKPQLIPAKIDLHFDKQHGRVLFKVEKQWKYYSEIKDQIIYDPTDKKFVGWTYVYPDGFVPFDSAKWTVLHPYAQVSKQVYTDLLTTANKFWTHLQPEIDPGVEKPCVLQVLVISRLFQNSQPSCVRTIRNAWPSHCQLRLFDEMGRFYSVGLWTNKKGLDLIFTRHLPGFTVSTANYWLSIPDVQERSKFVADSVSIPVSLARFSEMKEKLESINKNGGLRFCMTNRNCCRLAQEMLTLAGVTVDTRTTLMQTLGTCVPLPLGQMLSSVSEDLSSLFGECSPSIKEFCSRAGQVALFLPQKVFTFDTSLLFLCLGGAQGAEVQSQPYSCFDEDDADPQQMRLINSFQDMFTDETAVIYQSHILRSWAQKQGSYQFQDNQIVSSSERAEEAPPSDHDHQE